MFPFAALSIPMPVLGTFGLFVASGTFLQTSGAVSMEDLVAQAPFIGAILLLIWWFLRFVERKDERFNKVIDANTTALTELTVAVKTMGQK